MKVQFDIKTTTSLYLGDEIATNSRIGLVNCTLNLCFKSRIRAL